jgi:hypothetical protein
VNSLLHLHEYLYVTLIQIVHRSRICILKLYYCLTKTDINVHFVLANISITQQNCLCALVHLNIGMLSGLGHIKLIVQFCPYMGQLSFDHTLRTQQEEI